MIMMKLDADELVFIPHFSDRIPSIVTYIFVMATFAALINTKNFRID